MSETQDLLIYNIYDYMKSIYIYSHVKTYLIDPKRQEYELIFDKLLLAISLIFLIFSGLKVAIIVLYFIFIQAFAALISFIKSLFKIKFKINFWLSFINGVKYIIKVAKRIITFNFYLYENNIIGTIMIISYFFFLICSFYFFLLNHYLLNEVEKTEEYMKIFYLHFESLVLIQLLCSSFYALRNTKLSIICAFFIFIFMNLIIIVGYVITDRIENIEGKFEYDDPQKVMNIIINLILILLNGNCIFALINSKKSK